MTIENIEEITPGEIAALISRCREQTISVTYHKQAFGICDLVDGFEREEKRLYNLLTEAINQYKEQK